MRESFKPSIFSKSGFRIAYILCFLSVFNFTFATPVLHAYEAKKREVEQQINIVLQKLENPTNTSFQQLINHFQSYQNSALKETSFQPDPLIASEFKKQEIDKKANSKSAMKPINLQPIKNIYKPLPVKEKPKSKGEEGIIGLFDDMIYDNPSDNTFIVNLDNFPQEEEIVWLTYEILGVEGSSGVSNSINGSLTSGGYMALINTEWKMIKEPVTLQSIKKGENFIRFSIPPNAEYGYKVRNVQIITEPKSDQRVLFVEPEIKLEKNGATYLKGILTEKAKSLFINGQRLKIEEDLSFEGIVQITAENKREGFVEVKILNQNGVETSDRLEIAKDLKEADFSFDISPAFPTIKKEFGLVGDEFSAYGAVFTLPSDAVPNKVEISISQLRKIDIAPLDQGLSNVTLNENGYRFLPHGIKFLKEGKVALPFDEKLIPSGNSIEDIRTYYFEERFGNWVELELDSIDLENKLIISKTDHFTDMINGVIQVPESPQTNAFAPTMMSDIKAADPTAGIHIMQPPTASQDGAAHISYPIVIPSGRNGMQPNLSIQYNSEGGNGWMGLGWNISSPAVTLDTRWGVPEFNPNNESEIYMLNGEQLVYSKIDPIDDAPYLPNRHRTFEENGQTFYTTATKPRNNSGVERLYIRKGDVTTKVERLGTSPKNYYWKVASPDGTISWYGGDETGLKSAWVIKNDNDNAVHWALVKTVDVYGNKIMYNYTNEGSILYLNNIRYTGKEGQNSDDGQYEVLFDLDNGSRPDITINGRLGLKQVQNKLLQSIRINYNGGLIREYKFNYTTNITFKKTLLKTIVEFQENGEEKQRHILDYFDDVTRKDGGATLFSSPQTINMPDVNPSFLFNLDSFLNPSRLGSSQNTNLGWGVSGLLGLELTIIGLDKFHKTTQSKTENFTLGTGYFENKSTERGMLSLIDVNGDGYKDLVFRTNSGINYYPKTVNRTQFFNGDISYSHNFGQSQTLKRTNGQSVYNYSTTRGVTKSKLFENFEINYGSKHLGLKGFVNKKRYISDYNTQVYFVDANNDGLPDLVDTDSNGNQIVYFNRLDNGQPTFSPSSLETPNLLIVAEAGMSEVDYDESDPDTGDMNYDAVRMWQAPFRGTIKIEDTIQILGSASDSRLLYTIETAYQNNPDDLYRLQLLDINDHSVHSYNLSQHLSNVPLNKPELVNTPIKVEAGQKVLFRIHNLGETNEELIWNPKISYLTREVEDPDDFPIIDQNGKSVIESSYKESFLLSNKNSIKIIETGNLQINWNDLPINSPSDTLYYRIYIDSSYPESNLIFQKSFAMGTVDVFNDDGGLNIYIDNKRYPTGDIGLRFTVTSDSNVKWQDLEWKPIVTFIPDSDPTEFRTIHAVAEHSAYELNNEKNPNINSYSNFTVKPRPNWVIPNEVKDYSLKPNSNIAFSSELNGEFIMVIKENGILLGKKHIYVSQGELIVVEDETPVIVYSGNLLLEQSSKNISVEFYAIGDNNSEVLKAFANSTEKHAIIGYDWSTTNLDKYFMTDLVNFYFYKSNHGLLVSNWGQFFYNESFNTNESTEIPFDDYGKLIDYEFIDNPFVNADLEVLFNNLGIELDPDYEYTQAELDQILLDALNMPDVNASEEDWEAYYTLMGGGALSPVQIAIATRGLTNDEQWIGIFSHQYIKKELSYLGDIGDIYNGAFDDDVPESEPMQLDLETGMFALVKKVKSVSHSFGSNIGTVGVTTSDSGNGKGYNKSYTDFMDINGDGYPELVYESKIQKTNMTGGHGIVTTTDWGDIVRNASRTVGASISYSPNIAGLFSSNHKASLDQLNGSQSNKISISPGGTIGISANLEGYNEARRYWMDLNGDGLPDLITLKNGEYKFWLNKGFKSQIENNIDTDFTNLSQSKNAPGELSANVGFSLNLSTMFGGALPSDFDFGFSVSAGAGSDFSNTEITFIDVNGDGLIDLVKLNNDNKYYAYLNNGNGFSSTPLPLSYEGNSLLNLHSVNDNISFNAGIDFDHFQHKTLWTFWIFVPIGIYIIPIPVVRLHGKAGISAQANGSVTKSDTKKSIEDFDGDGYPDFVERSGKSIKVYYSNIKRTNKLKSVVNPIKGSFELDYTVQPSSYEMSGPKWVLSKVEIDDWNSGNFPVFTDGNRYQKFFKYEDGFYDRREREFYGFETVKTIDLKEEATINNYDEVETNAYRTQINRFHNKSYFLKGALKESYMIKGFHISSNGYTDIPASQLFSKTVNTYELNALTNDFQRDVNTVLPLDFDTGGSEGRNVAAASLKQTDNYIYELNINPIHSKQVFTYDELGRVTKLKNFGDVVTPDDDFVSQVIYHEHQTLTDKNILSIPKEIIVKLDENTSDYIRKRETENIDWNTGAIGTLKAYYHDENENEVFSQSDMSYNSDGNLLSITYPENQDDQRVTITYEYDDVIRNYPIKVTDNMGYFSESEFEFKYGNLLKSIDVNENEIHYEYDNMGRPTKVKGPKDLDYTLKFEYYPYANTIEGQAGYAITKHFDYQNSPNDIETYTFVDGLGRAIQVKKDYDEQDFGNNASIEKMSVSGQIIYDKLGRVVEEYQPSSEVKGSNSQILKTGFIYPTTTQYDELDRVIQVDLPVANHSSFMSYSIDTDGFGNKQMKTTSIVNQSSQEQIKSESYTDFNGRTTSVKNIGATGDIWTKYKYDNIGQIMEVIDAEGNIIKSEYDQLGRRVKMTHPDAGTSKYWYDPIGNLTKMQTPNLLNYPVSNEDKFIKYAYDELNRLVRITYPPIPANGNLNDVAYGYGSATESTPNAKGKLISQQDGTGKQTFEYGNMGELIKSTRYIVAPNLPDRKFVHQYEYDSWNRLQKIIYPDAEEVSYFYDLGGNLVKMTGQNNGNPYDYIKQITYDQFEQRTAIKYGNNTVNEYSYSPQLRRLTSMQSKQSNNSLMLNNSYTYDFVGNITELQNIASPVANKMGGNYVFSYSYDKLNRLVESNGAFNGYNGSNPPNFEDLSANYSLNMTYDNLHNITQKTQNHVRNGISFEENTYAHNYNYSQDKPHQLENMQKGNTNEYEQFGYDANGNMVRHSGEDDKFHFWDESNRLRSTVVDGGKLIHNIYDASGERTLKAHSEYQGVFENGTPTDGGATLESYTTYPSAYMTIARNAVYTKHYFAGTQRVASKPAGSATRFNVFTFEGSEELKMKQLGDAQAVADSVDLGELVLKDTDPGTIVPSVYYFHPDHLGSSTVITDGAGYAYQIFLNLPFGETLAEQRRSGSLNNPFKFNGKELDSETGLYYYGARYYDPRVSTWLSVDPIALWQPVQEVEHYIEGQHNGGYFNPQNMNVYGYTYQNPINWIDPNGKQVKSGNKNWLQRFRDKTTSWTETNIRGPISHELAPIRQEFSEMRARNHELISERVKPLYEIQGMFGGGTASGLVVGRGMVEKIIGKGLKHEKSILEIRNITQSQNISKFINIDKQARHKIGITDGRSVLKTNAQSLLDNLHNGDVKSIRVINKDKTSVDFGITIGDYFEQGATKGISTTKGTVINSKTGVHIVPARPN